MTAATLAINLEAGRKEKFFVKIIIGDSYSICFVEIIIHTDQKLACLQVLLPALPEQIYSGPACELEAVVALGKHDKPLIHFVEQGEVLKHKFAHFTADRCDVSQHNHVD